MIYTAQKDAMSELNEAVRMIYSALTAITDADATFLFDAESKDPSIASGEFIEIHRSDDFGDFAFGPDQKILRQWGAYPEAYFSVRLPCYLILPHVLQQIFASHAHNELFDKPFQLIGLSVEVSVHWSWDDMEDVPLNSSTTNIRLDAFTESYFRCQAEDLVAELAPYLDWLRYFEHMGLEFMHAGRREKLIADANMILAYLHAGGVLNFAKMTSLCDVAGSLQPVRNLIQTKMPDCIA